MQTKAVTSGYFEHSQISGKKLTSINKGSKLSFLTEIALRRWILQGLKTCLPDPLDSLQRSSYSSGLSMSLGCDFDSNCLTSGHGATTTTSHGCRNLAPTPSPLCGTERLLLLLLLLVLSPSTALSSSHCSSRLNRRVRG